MLPGVLHLLILVMPFCVTHQCYEPQATYYRHLKKAQAKEHLQVQHSNLRSTLGYFS